MASDMIENLAFLFTSRLHKHPDNINPSILLRGQLTVTAPTNNTIRLKAALCCDISAIWWNRKCQLRCTCRTLMSDAFLPTARSTHQPTKHNFHSSFSLPLFLQFPFFLCMFTTHSFILHLVFKKSPLYFFPKDRNQKLLILKYM